MTDRLIKFLLMFLLVFTPVAFGSVELWAYSFMELGILLMIVLWAIQSAIRIRNVFSFPLSLSCALANVFPPLRNHQSDFSKNFCLAPGVEP